MFNADGCKFGTNSTWNLDKFESYLTNYHDIEVIKYLKYGWPINTKDTVVLADMPRNQKGVDENEQKMINYLECELRNKAIVGPFRDNPFGKIARFSPLGTRNKKDNPSKIRVIHNLSYPFKGPSVNDSIDKDHYLGKEIKLKYPGVDNLVQIIMQKIDGQNTILLFKRDLTRAYRQIFIDIGFIHLVGFSYKEMIFFDLSLSMGLKISAYICQRISSAVIYIFRSKGHSAINYLDDLGGAEIANRARKAFEVLGELLTELRIDEATSKASPQAHA